MHVDLFISVYIYRWICLCQSRSCMYIGLSICISIDMSVYSNHAGVNTQVLISDACGAYRLYMHASIRAMQHVECTHDSFAALWCHYFVHIHKYTCIYIYIYTCVYLYVCIHLHMYLWIDLSSFIDSSMFD